MTPAISLQKPIVGIDLGGTKILAAVVTEEGTIIGRAKKRTRAEKGAMEVLERICATIRSAIESSGVSQSEIAAIGIGSPGPLDPESGIVVVAPNLGWKNVNVKAALEGEFQIPTFVENDVNAGTLGEYHLGAGRGVSDLVGIFVGTGIGSGIIINHQLYRGFNKTAGEIGHMIIVENGPLCGCGNRGCLEALASRPAMRKSILSEIEAGKKSLITKLVGKNPTQIKSQYFAECLAQGDKVVTEALKKGTRYLGIGIAGIINFLNPEMIILGGGVVEAMKDFYLAEVSNTVSEFAFPHAARGIRIVPAQLGDDAGILGASVMARLQLKKSRS